MMTSLGHCCWSGRRFSQSPNCWSSCNISGKMSECEEDRNKGMVSDVERGRSLCGRETLSSMRDRICVCVAVMVVVVVLMVAVGVVVFVVAWELWCW